MKIQKVEISIKVSLFIKEYHALEESSSYLEISKKKIVNKSIKYAWKDYVNNAEINRKSKIYIGNDSIKQYSFKIKEKQYERLEEMSQKTNINKKELLRNILSYYPEVVRDNESYEND